MPDSRFKAPKLTLLLGNDSEGFVDWSRYVLECTIDLGTDTVPATAQLRLSQRPDGFNLLHQARISLGYEPYAVPVFRGFLLHDQQKAFPYEMPVRAVGALHRAQYRTRHTYRFGPSSPDPALRGISTNGAIVRYLLEQVAGCEGVLELYESGTAFGVYRPAELSKGQTPYSLIDAVDQVCGTKTFDGRGEFIVRALDSRTPASTPMWWYEQGVNILEIERSRDSATIHNAVTVTGRPLLEDNGTGAYKVEAIREQPDAYDYVWDLPDGSAGFLDFEFRSDLIESQTVADAVADRLIVEKNRLPDELTILVPGNPFLAPASTIAVLYPQLKINSWTPYYVEHITHLVTPDRFDTRLKVVGYPGNATYADRPAPLADAVYRVTVNEAQTVATLTGDASGSTDPAGDPTALEYAWASSAGSNLTTAGAQMQVDLTDAQLTAGVSLLLVVRSRDGRSRSVQHIARSVALPDGMGVSVTPVRFS